MGEHVVEAMIEEERLRSRVRELAAAIDADTIGDALLAICVLKGSLIFYADLVRALTVDVHFDTMKVSSYGAGTSSSGAVHIVHDLTEDIRGKDVLIVEDIVDSGHTLRFLREVLGEREPRTLRVVTLLSKPERRQVEVPVEYIGFEVPNEFIVGYGLDMNQQFRALPYIGKVLGEI